VNSCGHALEEQVEVFHGVATKLGMEEAKLLEKNCGDNS